MAEPVSVFDAAAYILEKSGRLSAWKLQKLCYYAQAWSLVWDEEPLFAEPIEAWANGPVVPALYQRHRGKFHVAAMPAGKASRLDATQRETVDAVLDAYGDKPGASLSELTHRERPWREARRRAGLAPEERGGARIPLDDIAEYYERLYSGEDA